MAPQTLDHTHQMLSSFWLSNELPESVSPQSEFVVCIAMSGSTSRRSNLTHLFNTECPEIADLATAITTKRFTHRKTSMLGRSTSLTLSRMTHILHTPSASPHFLLETAPRYVSTSLSFDETGTLLAAAFLPVRASRNNGYFSLFQALNYNTNLPQHLEFFVFPGIG
ncbi:hypothetical protein QCA50_004427 [Cerrena zonata]|uniref:Uncharacterized protein n=1 Tax=Cerrena zonata TaxID=2478898 RepID=A0AAW0GP04_9APHY